MFYKRYIYKGQTTKPPDLAGYSEGTRDTDGVTVDVRDIVNRLVKPTDYNNEVLFHLDNIAPSFVASMASSIIGDMELNVKVPGYPDDEKKIKEWNDNINVNGDTIKDALAIWFFDNCIFNRTYWRFSYNEQDILGRKRNLVDMQRMDPKTIVIEEDKKHGWRVLVQQQSFGTTAKTPMKFIKGEYETGPSSMVEVVIPEHIKYVMSDSYFISPPVDRALPYMHFKTWLLNFMQKHANKNLSGYLLGFIGDPKSNIYPQKKMMDQAILATRNVLQQMKNFGVGVFPGDTKIQQITPPDNGANYINLFNLMNMQIMFALYGSMSMLEGDSVYKASERVDETNSSFVKGIRMKMREKLLEIYTTHIVPNRNHEEIVITFPEVRNTMLDKVINAITEFSKLGIFKDSNEKRRAASVVFPFLWENSLTEEEQKLLHDEFVELNKPSEAVQNKDKTKDKSKSNE